MKILLFLGWFMVVSVEAWSVSSWREKTPYQIPSYPDPEALCVVEKELQKKSPIVFAGECDRLRHQLALASHRRGFVLMGGDCAETFDDFTPSKVRDDFRLILQISLVLMYGSGLPVTQIGRIAGQFGKPRSAEMETIDGETLPVYRGDLINGAAFDREVRRPDPDRLLNAYHQSVQVLNLVRAFIQGGLSEVDRFRDWDLFTSSQSTVYRDTIDHVDRSLLFMQALGVKLPRIDRFFTGHECLFLPYEEALTRVDSITGRHMDCSAHFLWLGERTRKADAAQVEFLKGVANPIGIKISADTDIHELLEIIEALNPDNEPGRITLITRMGRKLRDHLPPIIQAIKERNRQVLWCCDPMHGNTFTLQGIKTRSMRDVMHELQTFFDIHEEMGTFPGGIHLEMTSGDVTECLDAKSHESKDQLQRRYETTCDPRLNAAQALEIGFFVARRLLQRKLNYPSTVVLDPIF